MNQNGTKIKKKISLLRKKAAAELRGILIRDSTLLLNLSASINIQSWPDVFRDLRLVDDPYYEQNYADWKTWLFTKYNKMKLVCDELNAFHLRSLLVSNYGKLYFELSHTCFKNYESDVLHYLCEKTYISSDIYLTLPTYPYAVSINDSFLQSELGLGFILRDQGGAAEESAGIIEFKCVTNDRTPESMTYLSALKLIFSRQLPRMPREYISRLTFDRQHYSLVLIKNGEVVGGICIRPFFPNKFVEIVFLAVTNKEQVKGYGTRLMNHVKEYLRHRNIEYFLTYADNFALGYFRKQGFNIKITMPKHRWVSHIKDYDGGTLMECIINSKINYLRIGQQFIEQRLFVQQALLLMQVVPIINGQAVWESYVNEKNSNFDKDGTASYSHKKNIKEHTNTIFAKPTTMPGLSDAGWSDQQYINYKKTLQPLNDRIIEFLNVMSAHEAAWPFLQPVCADEAPDYYTYIKHPMDISKMYKNAENKVYKTKDDFGAHLKLIFDNCRFYNQKNSIYYKLADKLEQAMMPAFEKLIDN